MSARVVGALLVAFAWVRSGGAEVAAPQATAAPEDLTEKTAVIAEALAGVAPEGWKAAELERYVVANLYDKINGRSELFMSYGVAGLAFLTVSDPDDSSRFIDVYLYDMASVPGAFGVFSVERWAGQEPLRLGREGYRNGNDLFFWKGRYYASILGSGEEPEVREAQTRIAQSLAAKLEDSGEKLWGFQTLPLGAVEPDSVQYFMADALSLSFMSDTYTAQYQFQSEGISAFVSRAASEADASARHAKYVDYMRSYGAQVEESTVNDTSLTVADMGGGYYDVVAHEGAFVAGVTAVADKELALRAASEWLRALKR
jgi:hypothetical protein